MNRNSALRMGDDRTRADRGLDEAANPRNQKDKAGKAFDAVKDLIEGEVERSNTEPVGEAPKGPKDANGDRGGEPRRKTDPS